MEGSVREKNGSWYYSFEVDKVNGKRKRVERYGGKTRKEALGTLEEELAKYKTDGVISSKNNMTVSDFLDFWYNSKIAFNTKHNTQESYKSLIKNHIKPSLGSYKLSLVTHNLAQEFITKKYLSGFGKVTLESLKTLLSVIFKDAIAPYGLIKSNPFQYVKVPKYEDNPENSKKDIVSTEDFNRIIARFKEGSSFYIPLLIGYFTGARISEVFALTWNDIDFENKTIKVSKQLLSIEHQWFFETPKTRKSNRTINIGDILVNILKRHYDFQIKNKEKYDVFYNRNYLINSKKNPMYSRAILQVNLDSNLIESEELFFICTKENGKLLTPDSFKYASKVINYELLIQFNFHRLRHTQATVLLENGVSIKTVQDRLGHDRVETTLNTYAHVTDKTRCEAVDIFDKCINTTLNLENNILIPDDNSNLTQKKG